MKKLLLCALCCAAIAFLPAAAQAPPASWCTPQNACTYSLPQKAATTLSGIGTYGKNTAVPTGATSVTVTLVPDTVTSAYTVALQTAPIPGSGSPSYTSCATGTLAANPSAPLVLTCTASSTTGGWSYMQVVTSGGSAAGGYHLQFSAVLPGSFARNASQPPSQVTVPTVSLWSTAVNQQGTYSQTNIPQGVLIADSNTSTFNQVEGALAAYPGTAFTLDVLIGLPYTNLTGLQVGILTASSATGNMELIGPRVGSFAVNAIAAWAYYVQDFTAPATYSAGPFNGISLLGATYIWLQYKDDGTNIYYNASGDGFTWGKAYTVAKTSGFLHTNGYNFIGVGMYPSQGTGIGSGFSVQSWKITTP